MALRDADVPYEEDLLHSPYDLKAWIRWAPAGRAAGNPSCAAAVAAAWLPVQPLLAMRMRAWRAAGAWHSLGMGATASTGHCTAAQPATRSAAVLSAPPGSRQPHQPTTNTHMAVRHCCRLCSLAPPSLSPVRPRRYIEHKKKDTRSARYHVYERALKHLPGRCVCVRVHGCVWVTVSGSTPSSSSSPPAPNACSYKLWHAYLTERVKTTCKLAPLDPARKPTNEAFERALVFMHKVDQSPSRGSTPQTPTHHAPPQSSHPTPDAAHLAHVPGLSSCAATRDQHAPHL